MCCIYHSLVLRRALLILSVHTWSFVLQWPSSCSHGDFNLPDNNRDSLRTTTMPSHCLCDLVFDYNSSQLVHEPRHNKGSILNIILTNHDHLIHNVIINNHPHPFITSYHKVISFSFQSILSSNSRSSPAYFFNYSKADMASISDYLLEYHYNNVYNSTCINETKSP